MKKIYKFALGAGAAASVATPAIAVVSCGHHTTAKKKDENGDTELVDLNGNKNSNTAQGQVDGQTNDQHAITETFKSSESALLTKFKELKIAEASATDADFDKNFGDYTVKLLNVISTNEDALSTEDTTNLINAIIAKYQSSISADILPEVVKQTPVIAKIITENHLLKGAIEALGFDAKSKGKSEDTDLLEKLDTNNLNLVKAALFVARAVQSIPKDLSAGTTTSVLNIIKSLEIPELVKSIFPDDEQAMAAWAAVLNSGIIQEVGAILQDTLSKGVGNIDFAELKTTFTNLITTGKAALAASRVSISGLNASRIAKLVDSLNITSLVDIIHDIVTEGVFGINTKISDEITLVANSGILDLVGALVPALKTYQPVITTFTALINKVTDTPGVASLTQQQFEASLETILKLVPGASISTDIKSLVIKALYQGWSTQEEFDNFIKSLIPDSVMKMEVSQDLAGLGKIDIKVGELLMNILDGIYSGNGYKPTDILAAASIVNIDLSVSPEVAKGLSPLLHKGLLRLTEDEMKHILPTVQSFASQINGILQSPLIASQLPASAKPILDTIAPILNAFVNLKPEIVSATSQAIFDLLNHGIASSAENLRKAVPQIFDALRAQHVSLPSFIEPVVSAALNGLDSITVDQAKVLANWISTLIPANTPFVSSPAFKEVILAALAGQDKLDAYKPEVASTGVSTDAVAAQFEKAKADLLKKFVELHIADQADAVANFDKNSGEYLVKLLHEIATNPDALSVEDTTNLLDVIIAQFQKDIPAAMLPEILKQTPVVAKYLVDNDLLSGALDVLEFDTKSKGKSEDTDLLEKLDSNQLDLVKAALFVAKAVQSIPTLESGTTESVLNIIKTLSIPDVVKSIFPTNEKALQAWTDVINSGIIQEVGNVLNDAFAKGIGNIDFDELKTEVQNLITKLEAALPATEVSLQLLGDRSVAQVIDELNIPGLIDILKGIVTEGVFGIDSKLSTEINSVLDSNVLGLLSSFVPAIKAYEPMITMAADLVGRVTGEDQGIAGISEDSLKATIDTIMKLVPGASLSADTESLVMKVLFHGWTSKEEFDTFVKTLLPDSVMTMRVTKDLSILGKLDFVVGDLLMDIINALYTGTPYQPSGLLSAATLVGIDVSVSKDVAQGISPLLQKGLFALSEDEFSKVIPAVQKFARQISNILGSSLVAGELPESAKPTIEMIKPILSTFVSLNSQTITTTSHGIYDLLNHGVAASADEFRNILPQLIASLKSNMKLPAFVEPLILAACNGLDSISIDNAKILADWIVTLVPKDIPVVSGANFGDAIFTMLIGQKNIDAHITAQNAEANRLKAIAEQNALIDALASQKLAGSVSDEVKSKSSDLATTSDVTPPQGQNGLIISVKTVSAAGTKLLVTFTVSSPLEGTKVAEYHSEIEGFHAAAKLTPAIFVEELKNRLIAANIDPTVWGSTEKIAPILQAYLTQLNIQRPTRFTTGIIGSLNTKALLFGKPSTWTTPNYATFADWISNDVKRVTGVSEAVRTSLNTLASELDALNA